MDPDTSKVRVLTQREHVLERADMYVGSTHPQTLASLAWEETGKEVLAKSVEVERCAPALLHLVSETVVNAVDNAARCAEQRQIGLSVDRATGEISVFNDGSTVPVERYDGTEEWTPTKTFGCFFSGSNFDDSATRLWGGRFGIGIKAVNVWSTHFAVSGCDAARGKRFEQAWSDNMAHAGVPCITAHRGKKSSTLVRFTPDYARLGMGWVLREGVSDELHAAIASMAYDACVCTRPSVSVSLDGRKLGLRSLQHYATALGGIGPFAQDVVCDSDGRELLRLCVATRGADGAASSPQVLAFVNGIRCCAGSHVEMAWRAILAAISAKARAKSRDAALTIKPQMVKAELVLAIVAMVPNPEFQSQTKDTLTTLQKNFGFAWAPSAAFVSALERSEAVERVLCGARGLESRALERSSKVVRGAVHVDKLDDARLAGKRGADCTLLVTEGDSAKAFAIAGLAVLGRDRFGVYALRGKPMNVRKFSARRIAENEQCAALMKILGLRWNASYDAAAAAELRYRRCVILSDQDVDGSHICGLMINFFQCVAPTLLDVCPDFLCRFVTPIVRVALPRGECVSFFSEAEHRTWATHRAAEGLSTGTGKYYKGLGTSSSKLAREYFGAWDAHTIQMKREGAACVEALDLFFAEGPKAAAERKAFLNEQYVCSAFVDYSLSSTSWDTFMRCELSHYSFEDNVRSIPSVVDGLKESQRKAIYAFLARRQTQDVKVAQAMAFAAEMSAYHHGENSLGETICALAQDHVGTNNAALLVPEGQFGSRIFKPAVHAAFRYIFTRLDPLTRCLLPEADDAVLERNLDDGREVEPKHYVPVVPLILINGAHGIGSGFSTHVPCYSPEAVCDATEAWLAARERGIAPPEPQLRPWYRGFQGIIVADEAAASFRMVGSCDVTSVGRGKVEVRVTELPVGRWTDDFKAFVRETLMIKSDVDEAARFVASLDDMSTDYSVDIVLGTTEERLRGALGASFTHGMSCDNVDNVKGVDNLDATAMVALRKILRLEASESLSNMHLFDARGSLRKYDIAGIVEEHGAARLQLYARRLERQLAESEGELQVASNKAKYISLARARSIDVFGQDDDALSSQMAAHGLPPLPEGRYMTDLPTRALTEQSAARYTAGAQAIATRIDELRKTTPFAAWRSDLAALRAAFADYAERKAVARDETENTDPKNKKRHAKAAAKASKRPKG